MKRSGCLLVATVFVSAALSGCPHSGSLKTTPGAAGAGGFDARALVPADSLAVLSVDVPTVLARPGIAKDPAFVRDLSQKVKVALGLEPALLRDTTIFVSPMLSESVPRRGAAIIPQLLRDAPGLGALGAAEMHAGQPVYKVGASASLTFLPRATVVGDYQSVRRVVDASRGQGASLPAGDRLYAVLDALSPAPLRLAVPVKAMASLLAGLSIPGLDKITTAGLSADFTGNELVVTGLALTSDPQGLATTLGNLVRQFAGKLAQSTLFKVFGDILGSVSIVTGADRVSLSVSVPLDLVRGILPMVLGSVGM